MPQRVDSNASGEVKVLSVFHVPHVTTLPLLEHGRRAHIGGDHVRELLIHEPSSLRA
jgi:hypothetical protein